MRPSTPNFNFNFSPQDGPSSPPQTPTTPQFQYRQYKTRRNGMYFSSPTTNDIPASNPIEIPSPRAQPASSPFYTHHSELSPRSSSPTSSTHSSFLSTSPSPPRSVSSFAGDPTSSPPLVPQKTHSRIISEMKANFTVVEFRDSEYEDYSDSDSIIRPTQYEDAESERGSVRSTKPNHLPKSREPIPPAQPIDPKVLSNFDALRCSDDEEDEGYLAHQAWIEAQRAEKRRKRRSSSSFKRSLAQSIGSDTDEEDLMPGGLLDANDAGSSARRLRRRTVERGSLIFDDPPARIEEESYEEVVEIEEEGVREGLARSLPYYGYMEDMEFVMDTSSEEEEDDDDDDDDDEDEDED